MNLRHIPVIDSIDVIGLQYTPPPGSFYGNARYMGFAPRSAIIQIKTDEEIIGIGEAAGNPLIVREYLKSISNALIGQSIFNFSLIQSKLANKLYHSGVQNELTGTLSGIDVAMLDAQGRSLGLRVCDLLGGCGATQFPVYASTGYFSDDPKNSFEDMLHKAKKLNFLGAKIKIGRGIKSDLERVAIARNILGNEILLIVDMNAAYTVDYALESIKAMEKFNIHWVEEPIAPWDLVGYSQLHARSPVPLSAGEAHYTAREFADLINGRCVDILQPSITYTGGLHEVMRIVSLAQLNNLRVAPHVWGSALGMATACHLAAAIPQFPHTDHPPHPSFLEYDIGAENPLRDHMLQKPILFKNSSVYLPEGSGLGVDINWDLMDKFRVC